MKNTMQGTNLKRGSVAKRLVMLTFFGVGFVAPVLNNIAQANYGGYSAAHGVSITGCNTAGVATTLALSDLSTSGEYWAKNKNSTYGGNYVVLTGTNSTDYTFKVMAYSAINDTSGTVTLWSYRNSNTAATFGKIQYGNESYSKSSLRTYMTSTVAGILDTYAGAMVAYSASGSAASETKNGTAADGDKVWAPSKSEVEDGGMWELSDNNKRVDGNKTWLRSFNATNSKMFGVGDDGDIKVDVSTGFNYFVRPALELRVASSDDGVVALSNTVAFTSNGTVGTDGVLATNPESGTIVGYEYDSDATIPSLSNSITLSGTEISGVSTTTLASGYNLAGALTTDTTNATWENLSTNITHMAQASDGALNFSSVTAGKDYVLRAFGLDGTNKKVTELSSGAIAGLSIGSDSKIHMKVKDDTETEGVSNNDGINSGIAVTLKNGAVVDLAGDASNIVTVSTGGGVLNLNSKTYSGELTIDKGTTLDVSSGTISSAIGVSTSGTGDATLKLTGNVTHSANGIASVVNTNGNTFTISGGSLSNTVNGTGTLAITADLSTNADYIAASNNTVASGNTLTLTAGTLRQAITNDGTVTFSGGTLGAKVTDGTLNFNETMTVKDAGNIAGATNTIAENKTLTLTGGTLGKAVTNSGTVTFTGGTLGAKVSGGTLNINADMYWINAGNIDGVTNTVGSGKTLQLSGGTLTKEITNDGTVETRGNVRLVAPVTGGTLKMDDATIDDACYIAGDTNLFEGSIKLKGGTLTKDVERKGEGAQIICDAGVGKTIEISGHVTGGTLTVQTGTVKYTNADKLGSFVTRVTNTGKVEIAANLLNNMFSLDATANVYLATGELLIDKTRGTGFIYLKANPSSGVKETLTVKNDVTVNATLNGSDGTIDMTGDSACKTMTIATLAGTTNLKIDVDMSDLTADKLAVGTISGATVNLTGINITKDITADFLAGKEESNTSGLPFTKDNAITYVSDKAGTGTVGSGGTYTITANTSVANAIVLTNNYKYTFTKGTTDGTLKYKVEATDLTFKKFVEGTLTGYTTDPATLSLTDNLENTGTGNNDITMGDNQGNAVITVNLNGHDLTSDINPSTITIESGKTFNLNGGNATKAGTTDTNTTFVVKSGGALAISGKANVKGVITNGGSLTLNGATSEISGSVTNSTGGTYTLTAGTQSGAVDNSGTMTVANAAFLTGTNTITNGGTMTLTDGTLSRGITNNGILDVNDGTLSAAITNTSDDARGTTNIKGTVTSMADNANNVVVDDSVGNLTVISGTISGAVTNNKTMTLNGGTVSGAVTNANGSTYTLTSGTQSGKVTNSSTNMDVNGGLLSGIIDNQSDGIITVADASYLGNSNNAITNAGTMTLTSGTLGRDITNTGTLNITGGTVNAVIGSTGTVNINGAVENTTADKTITATTYNVAAAGTLTALADNIGSAITNSGKVILKGGTLSQNITGGTIQISDSTEAGAGNILGDTNTVDSSKILTLNGGSLTKAIGGAGGITIKSGSTVTTDAGNIDTKGTNTVTGTLKLNGGTLDNAVTGAGTTEIIADTELKANLGTAITVDANKILTSAANYIGGAVTNNGTVALGAGTLAVGKTITGGVLNITGNVTADADDIKSDTNTVTSGMLLTLADEGTLEKSINGSVKNTGILSASLDKFTDLTKFENAGMLNLQGQLTGDIAGTGTTVLTENITIDGNRNVAGTLDTDGKTIDMQETAGTTAAYSTLFVGKLKGNSDLQLDVDLSGDTAIRDKLTIGGVDGTAKINVASINVAKDVTTATGSGNVTYADGEGADSVTYTVGGETGSITVTNEKTYTFTAGSAGVLNYTVEKADVTFKKFIEGYMEGKPDTLSLTGNMKDADANMGVGTQTHSTLNIYLNGHTLGEAVGNTVIVGTKTMNINGGTTQGTVYTGWTVAEGGNLNIGGTTDVKGAISNAGTLTTAGTTTLEGAVTGEGTLTNSGTLNITAANLGNAVTNTSGTVNLGAGNLTKVITDGAITTTGDVSSDVAKLKTTDGITNIHTLTLTNAAGGAAALTDAISGATGTVVIDGVITTQESIANAVTINPGMSLNTTGAITGDVINNGTLTASGTVDGTITNNGTLNMNMVYSSDTDIDNKATLNIGDKGATTIGDAGTVNRIVTSGKTNVYNTNLVVNTLTVEHGGSLNVDPSYLNVVEDMQVSGAVNVQKDGSVLNYGTDLDDLKTALAVKGVDVALDESNIVSTRDQGVIALGEQVDLRGTGAQLGNANSMTELIASGKSFYQDGGVLVVANPIESADRTGDASTAVIRLTDVDDISVTAGSKLIVHLDNIKHGQYYTIVAAETGTFEVDTLWKQSDIYAANKKYKMFLVDDTSSNYVLQAKYNSVVDLFADGVPGVIVTPKVFDNALQSDEVTPLGEFVEKLSDMYAGDGATSASKLAGAKALNAVSNMGELAAVQHGALSMANQMGSTLAENMGIAHRPLLQRDEANIKNIANAGNAENGKAVDVVEVGKAAEVMPQAYQDNKYDKQVWASYVQGKDTVDGLQLGGIAAAYDLKQNGTTVGADLWSSSNSVGGVAVTYAKGDVSSKDEYSTKNDAKYYGATIYNRFNAGKNAAVLLDVGYMNASNDITQYNSGTRITADAKTNSIVAGLRYEHSVKAGNSNLVPFAGVRYMHLQTKDYENSLGMKYEAKNQNIFLPQVGLNWHAELNAGDGGFFKPMLEAGYIWTLGNRDTEQIISGETFGYDIADKGSYYAKIGAEYVKANFTFGAFYTYKKGDKVKNNKWNVNMSWKF